MVKVKVDTKIILDFGGVSHELTKEESREIVRLLKKSLEGDEGQRFSPVDIKKLLDLELEEREKTRPVTYPFRPYRKPIEYPEWPWARPPIITCGG